MLDTPVVLRHFSEIASRYDIFLLDQFGVLHNGVAAIPGAREAVQMLVDRGKQVVICSNTSQRREYALSRFIAMGFPTQGVQFLTSGESCFQHLRQSRHSRAFVFGWSNPELTAGFLSGLEGFSSVGLDEADCVLFHGPDTMGPGRQPVTLSCTGVVDACVHEVLTEAAHRGLPALCANMDMQARMSNEIRYMPGVLKAHYEGIGGSVVAFGKPRAEFFDAALALALERLQQQQAGNGQVRVELARNGDGAKNIPRPGILRARALHVGDSLQHDIDGAFNARIDSLLITDHGIHRDEFASKMGAGVACVDTASGPGTCNGLLPLEPAPEPSLIRLVTNYAERLGHSAPTYIIRTFVP